MPKLKDISDGDRVEYPLEGKALVTRHSLSTQIKVDKMEQQREYILYWMLC